VAYFALKFQIEAKWATRIYDERQEEAEEMILKIPISLPYASDQDEFITTNTSFEKDGRNYRVIKQRYLRDTLHLVYLPDMATDSLDKTIKQWVASLIQNETQDPTGDPLLSLLILKDYAPPQNKCAFNPFFITVKENPDSVFLAYKSLQLPHHTPPPERS
jgi:hypothetical protein